MFFFISWGSKVVRRAFGPAETHHCEICNADRSFHRMVIYKVHHVWWLFRWVTQTTYARVCDVCHNGVVIPAPPAPAKGAASPIPFMDRMGWATGLGGLAGLVVLGGVAIAAEGQAETGYLANPVAGDIYEVDLTKVLAHPQAAQMYSTFLVTQVTPDSVQVRLPQTFFNTLSGASSAVTDGRARSTAFYTDEQMTLPRTALPKMRTDGAILEVQR